jgi:glycosyltransferase involved in cell wall biosynthesis
MALPVRNQAALLERALPAWISTLGKLNRRFEILVVDDGSSDDTAARADAVSSRHPEVVVLRLEKPAGFGAALRAAIDKSQYPLFFYTSLDYPYQPSDIRILLNRIDDVDFVSGFRKAIPLPTGVRIAQRILELAARVLIGLQREPLPGWLGWKRHCYARLVKTLFGVELIDVESEFKLFRREVITSFPIQSDGPFVHTEIVAKGNFRSFWLDELPIGAQSGVPKEALGIPFRMRDRWKDLRRLLKNATFKKPAEKPADETEPSPAPTPAAI